MPDVAVTESVIHRARRRTTGRYVPPPGSVACTENKSLRMQARAGNEAENCESRGRRFKARELGQIGQFGDCDFQLSPKFRENRSRIRLRKAFASASSGGLTDNDKTSGPLRPCALLRADRLRTQLVGEVLVQRHLQLVATEKDIQLARWP